MKTQTNSHIALINKPSLIVVLFSFCFSFWFVDFWRPINEDLFYSYPEIYHRYAYLPATFLNNNSFQWDNETVTKHKLNTTKKSTYNYGSSLLYSPFFFGALVYCKINKVPLEQGFSQVFQNAIHWSGVIYFTIALLLIRRILLKYFNENITAITLFSLFYGSSTFYYGYVLSEMPESQLLFLMALFLYLVHEFYKSPNLKSAFFLGLVFASISLVRYFEMYVLFFFLFFSNRNLKEVNALSGHHRLSYFFFFVLAVILLWAPQILFNQTHYSAGFNPYIHFNKYDFTDSRIASVIFDYKQGWLTYSPIMLLSIFGIFFMKSNLPFTKAVLASVLVVIIVVYGASWDWRNGENFSARRLSDAVVWLSLPFAALTEEVFYSNKSFFNRFIIKCILLTLVFSSFCLMASQSYLVITRKLISKEMNEIEYWNIFRKFKY